MIPKELQSRIEELAEVRAEDEFKIGNVHNMSDYIKGYKAGSAAMHAELEPVLRDIIKEVDEIMYLNECRCDVVYRARKRHEPNAICGYFDDLKSALAKLKGVIE